MQTPSTEVFYANLIPAAFLQRLAEAPIAYLPLGTLEWHGPHLPLGADGLQSQGFFIELARRVGGIVLPMLFLGPDLHQVTDGQEFFGMDIFGFQGRQPEQLPGSIYWLDDDLFVAYLERIMSNLKRAGFKIVVAHGHGPSTTSFGSHISDWSQRFGLRLFHCWRDQEEDDLGLQKDHAAVNETSITMAIYPDLVHMESLPQNMAEWPKAILGKDPRIFASAQVGQQIIRLQADRMEAILRSELAAIRSS